MHRPGDPSYSVESPIDKPKEIVSHAAILSERVFQNILWQRHDILLDVISLARDPELPQRLDETIELLQKGLD